MSRWVERGRGSFWGQRRLSRVNAIELLPVGYSTQPGLLGHSINYGKKPVLARVSLASAGFLVSASDSGVT